MTVSEIRKRYLNFFIKRSHSVIPSASLIPENDSTTLFTGSGMQALLPYLLGEKHPQGKRIVDSQKCFRAGDIDEVGDNRHLTFFEMLGNWSLGDYFKKEQIPWFFAFVTEELGLNPKRLYVSVFRGAEAIGIPRDEESVAIWQELFAQAGIDAKAVDKAETGGMQNGRIFYYDDIKNWWSRAGAPRYMNMGEPGGPDTEMFFDLGAGHKLHEHSALKDNPCHINCDCGRFLEIGNSVFMEYVKREAGFKLLPQKNVDFGGGLERMAAAVKDEPDIFLIDVFDQPRETIEQLSGVTYQDAEEEKKRAFRVILDHVRSATFLIADGAVPSNKDQGYVVRRLIRRSVRFAKKLGVEKPLTHLIAETYITSYKGAYPSLYKKKAVITAELVREEEKFTTTLQQGQKYFNKIITSKKTISGEDAFILYSTYGFPLEMTEELAQEEGITIDHEAFKKEIEKHQELSRRGAEQKFKGGLADHSEETTKLHTATHLLHAALRNVLGAHVLQRGSNITSKRLRFDFSHYEKVTAEELKKVEDIVNGAIEKKLDVVREEMTVSEAKKKGAIGIFEDTYAQAGGVISLYTVIDSKSGDVFSREICGGPHVSNTGELGHFTIQKEESVSAGVRRIKAVVR